MKQFVAAKTAAVSGSKEYYRYSDFCIIVTMHNFRLPLGLY